MAKIKYKIKTALQEERNIVHTGTIKQREPKWIAHSLRRNCLLKRATDGKTKVTRTRGRRHKQLLHYLKETGRYSEPEREAVDHTVWKVPVEGVWTVVTHTAWWWWWLWRWWWWWWWKYNIRLRYEGTNQDKDGQQFEDSRLRNAVLTCSGSKPTGLQHLLTL